MRRSHFLLLVGAALGAACSASIAPDVLGRAVPLVRLRPEPYSLTYYSGLDHPERTVVRDEIAWREVWAAIWRGHSPEPPLPQVDFAQEMLVVVALGERLTGGFGIFADSAFTDNEQFVIQVRTIAPGPRCFTTQALTQPVDVARVPRTELAIRFREQPEVHDCG
jgi:hypothetical protein